MSYDEREIAQEFETLFRLVRKAGVTRAKDILPIAELVFEVDVSNILGNRKWDDIAFARHVTIAVCYVSNQFASSKTLGRVFKKDHTTILNSLRMVKRALGSPDKEPTDLWRRGFKNDAN